MDAHHTHHLPSVRARSRPPAPSAAPHPHPPKTAPAAPRPHLHPSPNAYAHTRARAHTLARPSLPPLPCPPQLAPVQLLFMLPPLATPERHQEWRTYAEKEDEWARKPGTWLTMAMQGGVGLQAVGSAGFAGWVVGFAGFQGFGGLLWRVHAGKEDGGGGHVAHHGWAQMPGTWLATMAMQGGFGGGGWFEG